MKKKTLIIMITIVTLLVVGCGKTTNKEQGDKLSIKEFGWSYIQKEDENYITFGAKIYNPKGNKLAGFPKLKIIGRDKENKILFSYDENIDYIYPGENIYYANTYTGIKEKPNKVDITIDVDNNDWEDVNGVNYPKNTSFPVSNISEYKDENGSIKYTGEIKNNSSTNIRAALIILIYKKDGKIVGGYQTFSDSLKPKKKDTFEMYVDEYPEYDKYDFSSQVSMIN